MFDNILPANQEFFSPAEIAELLQVSSRTVQRWINYGYLTAFRLASTTRIQRDELVTFMETWQTAPPPDTSPAIKADASECNPE